MSQPPEPAALYRPVSGLAVAGFALALLFAIGVVAAAAVAYFSQLPLLIDLTWLLLPLLAGLLSLTSLIQIRHAEGLRIGASLGRWGLLLSAATGLGYLAYHAANEEALRRQASVLADRWLELLRQQRTYPAFWATLEPGRRDLAPALSARFLKEQPGIAERLRSFVEQHGDLALVDPDLLLLLDEEPVLRGEIESYLDRQYGWGGREPGPLAAFMADDLVQFIERWQDRAVVEPQGIRSWTWSEGRYHVVLGYRVTTPEGQLDTAITVRGSAVAGQTRRQWHVLMPETGLRTHLNPSSIGASALLLSASSRSFAAAWLEHWAKGRRDEMFFATRPTAQRQAEAATYAARLLQSPPGDPETGRRLFLADFAAFADGGLVQISRLKADTPTQALVVKQLRALFTPKPPEDSTYPHLLDPTEWKLPVSWRIEGRTAVFRQPVAVLIAPRHICQGAIEVACADPQVIAALEGKEKEARSDPGWYIRAIDLVSVRLRPTD